MYPDRFLITAYNNSVGWLKRTQQRLAEPDKRLHVSWSFWLTLLAQILWPAGWAIASVFLVGLIKEFWDHRYGSGFCVIDLTCNLLGIFTAVLLCTFLPQEVFS